MNPEYESKLSALLDYIGTTAKDADGFVRQQTPLVAQEIVSWEFWLSTVQLMVEN
jgi:hypothetical protein